MDCIAALAAMLWRTVISIPSGIICIEGWQEQAGDLFELQDLIWPV